MCKEPSRDLHIILFGFPFGYLIATLYHLPSEFKCLIYVIPSNSINRSKWQAISILAPVVTVG